MHTKHNKIKQLLSLVEIFIHFVLYSTREKITKLLQNKFRSPSCFVKSTPLLMKPISHKNSKQRNMKYLNPKERMHMYITPLPASVIPCLQKTEIWEVMPCTQYPIQQDNNYNGHHKCKPHNTKFSQLCCFSCVFSHGQ